MKLTCHARRIRTKLNIKQKRMARDLDISVKDLWEIENGRNVTLKTAFSVYCIFRPRALHESGAVRAVIPVAREH